MATKKLTIIEDTFIAGEFKPAGEVVDVDEADFGTLLSSGKAVEGDQTRAKKAPAKAEG